MYWLNKFILMTIPMTVAPSSLNVFGNQAQPCADTSRCPRIPITNYLKLGNWETLPHGKYVSIIFYMLFMYMYDNLYISYVYT